MTLIFNEYKIGHCQDLYVPISPVLINVFATPGNSHFGDHDAEVRFCLSEIPGPC